MLPSVSGLVAVPVTAWESPIAAAPPWEEPYLGAFASVEHLGFPLSHLTIEHSCGIADVLIPSVVTTGRYEGVTLGEVDSGLFIKQSSGLS